MKQEIVELIVESINAVQQKQSLTLTFSLPDQIQIDNTRDRKHGDYASNIALVLSKPAGMPPRELAELIVQNIPESDNVRKIEIAGPGFINFFLNQTAQYSVIEEILDAEKLFGHSRLGSGKSILLEFVSANPTGPLHVGHGRGAAYGAVVANLLTAIGYRVEKEYYVNDAGRQMDILAASVYLRYLEANNQNVVFPDNAYQGDYIKDIADDLKQQLGSSLCRDLTIIKTDDVEKQLDNLIAFIKDKLGDDYRALHDAGLNAILENIKTDLAKFGIDFDHWYSEQSLTDNNKITDAMEQLEAGGYLYEKDGAKWFRSESLGDEKDRVVVRENGEGTYFASDIAYHHEKFNRGYDKIIDIWGADHHGYIARVRAASKALGCDEKKLDILLVQFVTLFRGKEKMQMSTRSGQYVTLKELQQEVGKDAARFFYVMRKNEQHLDFDLELAKSRNKENPVYYIQYAHARICRLLEKYQQTGKKFSPQTGIENLSELNETKEQEILMKLSMYPEVLQKAALNYEPHNLVYYLKELSNDFHTYYETHRIMDMPDAVMSARLCLCLAIQQIIANGLNLLGVTAPESM